MLHPVDRQEVLDPLVRDAPHLRLARALHQARVALAQPDLVV